MLLGSDFGRDFLWSIETGEQSMAASSMTTTYDSSVAYLINGPLHRRLPRCLPAVLTPWERYLVDRLLRLPMHRYPCYPSSLFVRDAT
jgi:hypothetical protein